MARYTSQAFLGVRIECVQCHHHPSDRWGQDDYFSLAAMFSGVVKKKLPGGDETIAPGLAKDIKHPRTGELIGPARSGRRCRAAGDCCRFARVIVPTLCRCA
ncbi:MAG: DUF1549 domain-containing protein [Planctomycetales bacterium]|nr:DUF1549 domain-containing protein [Planctomycetales bacterium]